ncbi:hypothetical protein KOI35_22770 [Actinoplanes bogorensis]|uniref:Uncharacterized protein n=1 Tax=Paractinoplanes bogorensis TaxID=1610840 RepID=A0ABS5YW39_9ACTN|nr:hypothetical protein [Actinoplanes bogorensis]MBU2666330.1 hypothetical protein [Actinoplanes bogorensis]
MTAVLMTLAASGVLLSAALGGNSTEMARMSLAGSAGSAGSEGTPAMFSARQLVPGHAVSNCLPIVNGNTADRGPVRLTAADLTGPLVAGLHIRVELGTGGAFGNCTGFTGTTVFDGPLTGLAASGVSTGWVPAARETRTYRLTVEVADDNALQHSRATGTLTWLRTPGTAIPSTPSTPATPDTSGTPATTDPRINADGQTQASVRRTNAPFFDAASTGNAPQPNAARSGGPAGGSAVPAPTGWHAAAKTAADTIDVAMKLVGATARHPWYVLSSLAVMWLFLFAADRSEKRDPKRAYLRFPPDPEDGRK